MAKYIFSLSRMQSSLTPLQQRKYSIRLSTKRKLKLSFMKRPVPLKTPPCLFLFTAVRQLECGAYGQQAQHQHDILIG
eukprot:Awhi_evm1s2026